MFKIVPRVVLIVVSDKCKYIFILSFNNLWNSFTLMVNVKFEKFCFKYQK